MLGTHVTPETSSHSSYRLLLPLDPTAIEEYRPGTLSTGPILGLFMGTKKTLRGNTSIYYWWLCPSGRS